MNDVAQPQAAGVEDVSGRRLSFAFAKRHGVLVNRVVDGIAECIYRDTASPQALAEVRRYLRRSLRLERVPEAQFDELLRQERRLRVQMVLATLKPREAQLLLLRASGLAYRELAESLGINRASVGTMLARAEAEFERKFRARYGDEV